MGLYDRLSATALRLLVKFGQSVIHRQISISAYGPTISSAIKTATDTTRIGVLLEYPPGTFHNDGTLVQKGDKRLLLDATGPVTLTDLFLISGKVHTVANISELSPAGVIVMYDLRVQG